MTELSFLRQDLLSPSPKCNEHFRSRPLKQPTTTITITWKLFVGNDYYIWLYGILFGHYTAHETLYGIITAFDRTTTAYLPIYSALPSANFFPVSLINSIPRPFFPGNRPSFWKNASVALTHETKILGIYLPCLPW